MQRQFISADSLYKLVNKVSEETAVPIFGLSSSYSLSGIDLGSSLVQSIAPVKAAMLIGTGVAASEAGEIWHLLDERLHLPIAKIDLISLGRYKLDRYNTLIIVSGNYALIDKAAADKIKAWVQNGGTLITIKSGTEWAIKQGMSKEKIIPAIDSAKGNTVARINFDMASDNEGAKS
ncbi:MAG: hypothetical protein FYV88_3700, partial [Bacteroidetes bacterium]|nr:hypothetical protein [Bacteroidota bacterium]